MSPDERKELESRRDEFFRLWGLEAKDPSYKDATDAAQKALYDYQDYLEKKYENI